MQLGGVKIFSTFLIAFSPLFVASVSATQDNGLVVVADGYFQSAFRRVSECNFVEYAGHLSASDSFSPLFVASVSATDPYLHRCYQFCLLGAS